MQPPEIRYARSGDVSIAYQRWGRRGAPVFTWFPFFLGNIEVEWEEPHVVHANRRFGSFADVIHFDKRGSGLSGQMEGAPTLEERIDDARAVLDAEGVEHAFVGGQSEGGPLALLFAAMYPERVSGLVLVNSFAGPRIAGVPQSLVDYFMGVNERRLTRLIAGWGTSESYGTRLFAPSKSGDEAFERWMQRYERMSCTPQQARRLADLILDIDVNDVLASVQAPTLVIHCMGDDVIPFPAGREIAARVQNGRFVAVRARDHAFVFSSAADRILDEMEAFVTGQPASPAPTTRSLQTMLFTDIVASTARAAAIGDDRWGELLDVHDAVCRELVERWGGRLAKHTGDGVLALFDHPGRALDCALKLRHALEQRGLEIRVGVHTGEVEIRGRDVGGVGVHLASRVLEAAGAGEILSSATVRDLVIGSSHRFTDAGSHRFKGLPGKRPLYRLTEPVMA